MKNIVSYFEKQVAKHPDKIAIEYKDSAITYSKLNEKSNEFAHYLLGQDVKKNDTIALFLSRSSRMISTIFGIEKAGCEFIYKIV